jgi:hypothetical protein
LTNVLLPDPFGPIGARDRKVDPGERHEAAEALA